MGASDITFKYPRILTLSGIIKLVELTLCFICLMIGTEGIEYGPLIWISNNINANWLVISTTVFSFVIVLIQIICLLLGEFGVIQALIYSVLLAILNLGSCAAVLDYGGSHGQNALGSFHLFAFIAFTVEAVLTGLEMFRGSD
eukprot:TRINITY_DN15473_c0_g1_i1.p1 TRINITY_DN15473_c0_g1~~TRINITY_DN15473_c0_g1_i1.p1  ORF type:complete len:143 (-),score=21.33 TRINITY_DN15473_c0_g1_i1:143-571(-)